MKVFSCKNCTIHLKFLHSKHSINLYCTYYVKYMYLTVQLNCFLCNCAMYFIFKIAKGLISAHEM